MKVNKELKDRNEELEINMLSIPFHDKYENHDLIELSLFHLISVHLPSPQMDIRKRMSTNRRILSLLPEVAKYRKNNLLVYQILFHVTLEVLTMTASQMVEMMNFPFLMSGVISTEKPRL